MLGKLNNLWNTIEAISSEHIMTVKIFALVNNCIKNRTIAAHFKVISVQNLCSD